MTRIVHRAVSLLRRTTRLTRLATTLPDRIYAPGADLVNQAPDGTREDRTTLGVRGWETKYGTAKVSHEYPGVDDSNASALSLRALGQASRAQGIYLEMESTGKAVNLRRVFPDGRKVEFFTVTPPLDDGTPAVLRLNGKKVLTEP